MIRRYQVRGRVQGVGFRYFVERHARRLELDGYARNCDDGSVEVVASGADAMLAELEKALQRGPSMSRVTSVTSEMVNDSSEVGRGFRIF